MVKTGPLMNLLEMDLVPKWASASMLPEQTATKVC